MVAARDELASKGNTKKSPLPILLKVAPDLKEEEKEDIARVIQKPKVKSCWIQDVSYACSPGIGISDLIGYIDKVVTQQLWENVSHFLEI